MTKRKARDHHMRRFLLTLSFIATFIIVTTNHAFAANAAIIKATEAELLLVYLGFVGAMLFLGFAAIACVL